MIFFSSSLPSCNKDTINNVITAQIVWECLASDLFVFFFLQLPRNENASCSIITRSSDLFWEHFFCRIMIDLFSFLSCVNHHFSSLRKLQETLSQQQFFYTFDSSVSLLCVQFNKLSIFFLKNFGNIYILLKHASTLSMVAIKPDVKYLYIHRIYNYQYVKETTCNLPNSSCIYN